MSLLKVEKLSRRFQSIPAIDNLCLEIKSGGVCSIIGPNGAGKTTLLNLVSGVYRPNEGAITFAGQRIDGMRPYALAALGLSRTFQNLQIFFNMSAIENVMVGAHLHTDTSVLAALIRLPGRADAERRRRDAAAALMAEVGLGAYVAAQTGAMPYGALKRLEIARALATRPKMLLLDEPAAGLNLTEAREIAALIRSIAEQGVTVVLVEHNMRLVMGVSDYIFVLDGGRLISEGVAADITADPAVIAAYLGRGLPLHGAHSA